MQGSGLSGNLTQPPIFCIRIKTIYFGSYRGTINLNNSGKSAKPRKAAKFMEKHEKARKGKAAYRTKNHTKSGKNLKPFFHSLKGQHISKST